MTAVDGQQALSVFETAKPDLVLTEALLPKLNGFELCKKITKGELRRCSARHHVLSHLQRGKVPEGSCLRLWSRGISRQADSQMAVVEGCAICSERARTEKGRSRKPTPRRLEPFCLLRQITVKPVHDWGDPLEIDALFDVPRIDSDT